MKTYILLMYSGGTLVYALEYQTDIKFLLIKKRENLLKSVDIKLA